jgi:hypothetical protein
MVPSSDVRPARAPGPVPEVVPLPSMSGAGSMQALVSGELVREGRCLYLADGQGTRSLIVWHGDASMEITGEQTVVSWAGQRLVLPTTVEGSGGHVDRDWVARMEATVRDLDPSCLTEAVVVFG